MKDLMIFTLPFIAAVIGWFTNYLAVKMLFRPKNKVRFLFFEIQGVFPKRQHLVAEKIARMVTEELLSIKDIQDKMSHPENIEVIAEKIEAKIEDYLTHTFPENYPVMSFFIREKARDRIKEDFMKEVRELAPEVVKTYLENLESTLDIEQIIIRKISLLSPEKLEKLIMGVLSKEFRFIEAIGAVIGFIIGLFQVFIALIGQ